MKTVSLSGHGIATGFKIKLTHYRKGSVPEMADTGKDHCHIMLISSGNNLIIPNGAARLNRAGCSCFRGRY